MSDIYIPPPGLYFRLLGYLCQEVLFARTTQKPYIGGINYAEEYSDQLFSLIHGTGSREGTYAIKSKSTGSVLFARNSAPTIGLAGGDAQYDDNWFQLVPGDGKHAKTFRLVVPSQNSAIFLRSSPDPYVGVVDSNGKIYEDNYFTFLFEDMEIEKIEYDLELGRIISSTPLVLGNQTLKNDSNQPQEMSFQLNHTETQTSTFEYSTGFSVTVGMSVTGGIPFVAETKFSVDTTSSEEWKWGEQESYTKSYTISFPVKAGPHETVRAVSTVNKGIIEVPYTIYLMSRSNSVRVETKGIWSGVTTWDLRHTISIVS